MSSRSIEQLLKEGCHYDNDIKIMALNDLCAKMIEENNVLEAHVQNEICEIFLLHLDSTSIDVQSKKNIFTNDHKKFFCFLKRQLY